MYQRRNSQKPHPDLLSSFRKTYSGIVQPGTDPPAELAIEAGDEKQQMSYNPDLFESIEDAGQIKSPESSTGEWKHDQTISTSAEMMRFSSNPPAMLTPFSSSMQGMFSPGIFSTPRWPGSTPLSHELLESHYALSQEHPFAIGHPMNAHPGAAYYNIQQNTQNDQMLYQMSDFERQSSIYHMPEAEHPHPQLHQQRHSWPEDASVQHPLASSKFRFLTILKFRTALIKRSTDVPETYLNKGQTYLVTIRDTKAGPAQYGPCKYRTYIRMSFDSEEHRRMPAERWKLWKEGRAVREQVDHAVEFVGAPTGQLGDKATIELEQQPFDGFAFEWTTKPGGQPECEVQLRFNFLSTDFTHSKGVKGTPSRLCAKTELISSGSGHIQPSEPETCYCKVKVFRDHGADRKLTNDKNHVAKNINKSREQLNQLQAGGSTASKRRRSDSVIAPRPSKSAKLKRSQSPASDGSVVEGHDAATQDLRSKLAAYEAGLQSFQPESVFQLAGEELDDPDKYPVLLEGPGSAHLSAATSPEQLHRTISRKSAQAQSVESTPIFAPMSASSPARRESRLSRPPTFKTTSSEQSIVWQPPNLSKTTSMEVFLPTPQQLQSPPEGPTRVPIGQREDGGTTKDWIEAVDIDHAYQSPREERPKPVACFYIKPTIAGVQPEDGYYRAIYLYARNLSAFVQTLALKVKIDPMSVTETRYQRSDGILVKVDDEFVDQIQEGQDMNVQLDFGPSLEATKAYILTLRY